MDVRFPALERISHNRQLIGSIQAFNVLAVIVGIGLMFAGGVSGAILILVVGAGGLALKKLPPSVLGEDDPPA